MADATMLLTSLEELVPDWRLNAGIPVCDDLPEFSARSWDEEEDEEAGWGKDDDEDDDEWDEDDDEEGWDDEDEDEWDEDEDWNADEED